MEIPERASYAPSARWRQGAVHRGRNCSVAGVYLAQDGRLLSRCGPDEGVGESAMLRAIPRTAIAVAHDAGIACQFGREPFLAMVLGHVASHWQLGPMAEAWLADGAARGGITRPSAPRCPSA